MKRLPMLILLGLMLAPTMSASAPVDALRPFVRGSWQRLIAAHTGQPLVVHFWGVTCGPCRVEMPQWGAFLKQHTGLPLVMIDADLVPNEPAAAKAMLQQSGLANVESWIFNDDFVERLRYEIDPHWQGEIPLTLLIARDGSRTTLEGAADMAKVRSWLDKQHEAGGAKR